MLKKINSIDDASAYDLPTKAYLAIGAPVVIHTTPQFSILGVCNYSDGIIHSIDLDQRKQYLADRNARYSVLILRYPLEPVLVYIKSADERGLPLDHLPRAVMPIGPLDKTFKVVGTNKRDFFIKRRQLTLTAGCLSYVYRSEEQTWFMKNVILDIRTPPGNRADTAAVYIALSRATCLEDLYILFRVTLGDLNRLDRATHSVFSNIRHGLRQRRHPPLLSPMLDDDYQGHSRKGKLTAMVMVLLRRSLTYLRTAITIEFPILLWLSLGQREMRNTYQTLSS